MTLISQVYLIRDNQDQTNAERIQSYRENDRRVRTEASKGEDQDQGPDEHALHVRKERKQCRKYSAIKSRRHWALGRAHGLLKRACLHLHRVEAPSRKC